MALGGLEGTYVKYWDEGSMIAVLEFEVEQSTKSGQEQPSKERKEKKKKGQPSSWPALLLSYNNDSDYPRNSQRSHCPAFVGQTCYPKLQ